MYSENVTTVNPFCLSVNTLIAQIIKVVSTFDMMQVCGKALHKSDR